MAFSVFVRQKNLQRGKSMKQNSNLNHFQQLLFHTFPPHMNLITKTEWGAKTAPRVPKLGYKGGRVPQLSVRGTLATSGAGVVRHILYSILTISE